VVYEALEVLQQQLVLGATCVEVGNILMGANLCKGMIGSLPTFNGVSTSSVGGSNNGGSS
jgi:hypothetical protein